MRSDDGRAKSEQETAEAIEKRCGATWHGGTLPSSAFRCCRLTWAGLERGSRRCFAAPG